MTIKNVGDIIIRRNYPHNLFGDDFMTFFDESVSTARDILSAGAQKASETIEIQKIKIAIARKKSSINAALKNLGKAYYDSRKTTALLPDFATALLRT